MRRRQKKTAGYCPCPNCGAPVQLIYGIPDELTKLAEDLHVTRPQLEQWIDSGMVPIREIVSPTLPEFHGRLFVFNEDLAAVRKLRTSH